MLAGVRHKLSIISTRMKSNTNFLAGWLVRYVLVPTLQYSDWLLFMPESAAKALNSSAGDPTSSSRSVTCEKQHVKTQDQQINSSLFDTLYLFFRGYSIRIPLHKKPFYKIMFRISSLIHNRRNNQILVSDSQGEQ